MASKFKLYNSNNITLEYLFPVVQRTNAPQSPLRHLNIEGVRGIGSLIIPAGTPSWTLEIEGVLYIDPALGQDYEDIVILMDAMETAIPTNTAFYMRIYKTATTYYSYKVKRVSAIQYPQSLRTDFQPYTVELLVNSW